MGNNVENFYIASENLKNNLDESISANQNQVNDMIYRLELINDFERIFGHLESVKVWSEVYYDLFSSLYLALNGFYRNSFISLRSASELGLGFFFFTDYNYNYLKWKNNKYDLTWSSLSEENNGIISNNYLSTFTSQSVNFDNLIADYKEVYRYCSEYVHGKYGFMHTVQNPRISFNQEHLTSFISRFQNLTDLLFSIIIVRFNGLLQNLEQPQYSFLQDISKKYKLTAIVPEYGK